MFTTASTEFYVRERLRDLQGEIDKLHLNYLQTDQSPNKIEQRAKLESYIKELICLVPHENKFYLPETPEVLHRSACNLEGFSAYGAASAWNAIANYAANLLSQPWRKEFRELKLYCGFYKHEIEANLLGAQILLEEMGYKPTDESSMVLDGPIDPDRISSVSRDALVAYVECQLLKSVWEDVSQRFDCPWIEVVTFRENHVGSADHAARAIIYHLHQRQYLSRQYMSQPQQQNHHHHQRTLSTGYTIPPSYGPGYCGYGGYYTLPAAPLAHPITPVYTTQQPSLYGYTAAPTPPAYSVPQMNPINGYAQTTAVPTAQLIELAPATTNSPPPPPPPSKTTLKPTSEPPARPPADEGAGTFGSWDYVYRNLESQGYNKDIAERSDLTNNHRTSSSATTSSALTPSTSVQKQQKQQQSASSSKISNFNTLKKSPPVSQDNPSPRLSPKINTPIESSSMRLDNIQPPSSATWQCVACTYENEYSLKICSICGKSKIRGAEAQPLISGGQECPHCTLVNPKDATKCEACDKSLKGSPTYI